MMSNTKVIFIPGNDGGTTQHNWFPYLKEELEKLGLEVIAAIFPDPIVASEKKWLPFVKELGADEKTILIGHSSGAVAAMRFAETSKILGSVLVGACYTDLNDELEKQSGYYNRSWDWETIKANQKWIIQYASVDDPYIPVEEARHIHTQLGTAYYEYKDQGHFGDPERPKQSFPEIVQALKEKLRC